MTSFLISGIRDPSSSLFEVRMTCKGSIDLIIKSALIIFIAFGRTLVSFRIFRTDTRRDEGTVY